MTNPIDFTGIMAMQWLFTVDLTALNTSQTLNVKYGQRSVDAGYKVAVEPGVYTLDWGTNLPDTEWKSFYFRDYGDYDIVHRNFGSRDPRGSQRVVVPQKCWLYCYSTLANQLDILEPVVGVSLIPDAPLANAFE